MGSAGTGSSFVDRRGKSAGAGGHCPMRVGWRLVLTAAVSLVLSLFLSSCSGFFISPSITSIYIQPSAATVAVGQQVSLAAYATYSDGTQKQISGGSVGWSSSATSTATVTSPGGQVTGVAIGSSTITASSQGISGTATVTVTASQHYEPGHHHHPGKHRSPNHGDLSGAPASLQFYAYANGSANNDVTQAVSWSSSNTNVATISTGLTSGNGLVTSIATGTTNITASTTNSTTGQVVNSQTIVLTVQ